MLYCAVVPSTANQRLTKIWRVGLEDHARVVIESPGNANIKQDSLFGKLFGNGMQLLECEFGGVVQGELLCLKQHVDAAVQVNQCHDRISSFSLDPVCQKFLAEFGCVLAVNQCSEFFNRFWLELGV